jgi:hypothetical protein
MRVTGDLFTTGLIYPGHTILQTTNYLAGNTDGIAMNGAPVEMYTGMGPSNLQVQGGASFGVLSLVTTATAVGAAGGIMFGSTGSANAGTAAKRSAQILSTLTEAAASSMGGDLQFYVSRGGASDYVMRLRQRGQMSLGDQTFEMSTEAWSQYIADRFTFTNGGTADYSFSGGFIGSYVQMRYAGDATGWTGIAHPTLGGTGGSIGTETMEAIVAQTICESLNHDYFAIGLEGNVTLDGVGNDVAAAVAIYGALDIVGTEVDPAPNPVGRAVTGACFYAGGVAQQSGTYRSVYENLYGLRVRDIDQGTVSNYAIWSDAGLVSFGDSVTVRTGKNLTVVGGQIAGTSANTGYAAAFEGGPTSAASNGVQIKAGAVGTDLALTVANKANSQSFLYAYGDGQVVIGSGSRNANMTVGLTIDQKANDNQILAFKSSDVAHGATAVMETDTYFAMQKLFADQGGILLRAITESGASAAVAVMAQGLSATTADTTKTAAGRAVVETYSGQISGTGLADVTADANVFAVRCRRGGADATVMIIDEDGDAFNDGAGWTSYDDYDDVALLHTLDRTLDQRLRAEWSDWLHDNRAKLTEAKLAHFDEHGGVMVNSSAIQRLTVGAMRQMSARIEHLERRLLEAGS